MALPVVLGHCPEGPWIKALAVAGALRETDAEILIVADADVWAQGLPQALQAVRDGQAWAIPHRGVLRLSEAATARYLENDNGRPGRGARCGGGTVESSASYANGPVGAGDLAEPAYLGTEGGGIVLLRRETYEACPLDLRFAGWGSEDDAWGMALRTLYGPPLRVRAPLIHLFHPPQQRATRSYGSIEGRELRKRYAAARHNPTAMRSLIGEAHDAHRTHELPDDDRASQRR
jgi:hypothetical protein